MLRGTVTVKSELGVYELHEGEEEILDYSQPLNTPTAEPAIAATPTIPVPSATVAAPTATQLPTRVAPSETATVAVPGGEHEDRDAESGNESEDHDFRFKNDSPGGGGSGASEAGHRNGPVTGDSRVHHSLLCRQPQCRPTMGKILKAEVTTTLTIPIIQEADRETAVPVRTTASMKATTIPSMSRITTEPIVYN